jgi:hypothetical protein
LLSIKTQKGISDYRNIKNNENQEKLFIFSLKFKKMKDSKRKWKHHSNVTSKGNNSEKREQNLIYGNENAGLKITAENDLLVKNLESQESCDTNMCVVEFGVHITYVQE